MPKLLLPLATCLLAVAPAFSQDCGGLTHLQLPETTIVSADQVSGTFAFPGGGNATEMPPFCRVTGVLRPTQDSVIRFEVWLPKQKWNGRLLGVGNGGFAGSISYGQMAGNLKRGYATSGTDAGHQAQAEDASWAYRHPEKIADFGYRAIHLTALRSKDIVTAFYGKPQTKSYFDACSDGGREALMEAQRFPEDYDGILAGAPANNWARMVTGGLAVSQQVNGDPAAYLSSFKLPAINRASLAACDAQDGLKDGIISDPQHCNFNPDALLCKGEEDTECLTAPQVASLKRIYAGGKTAKGEAIFPGLVPGDENPTWHDWVLGNAPGGAGGNNYMQGYFRYMVFSDPKWASLAANPETALAAALHTVGEPIDSTNPDLGPLAARGGKLLIYHGWNDPAISPWNSIDYVKSVERKMGKEAASNVVELYMVPGMEHCAGGPGPDTFGQLSLPPAAGAGTGVLDALQLWVETGKKPEAIPAVKVLPAKSAAVASAKTKNTRTQASATSTRVVRPICPWPQEAKYNGTGDPGSMSSFRCVAP